MKFSKTERQVLELLSQGATNKEMAESLDNSVRTVETHRAHIAKKIGFSGVRLVKYAVEGEWRSLCQE